MNAILEIKELKKSYSNFALDNISFSLPEGCITGFIGANGAGKTTTIRTILGLTEKTSGNINVFGMPMLGNEKKIKDRLGIVFDDTCFYDEFSLVQMKSIIAPAYSEWNEKTFLNYLERFGLNPKQKIATLSRGMKMKYALAIALSHNAELLIMDEPTGGLDPQTRSDFRSILTEFMNNGGKGVFFSTHITSDLDKIADVLIMIDKGRIVFQEEKDSLLDKHRIVKGIIGDLNPEVKKLFISLQQTDYGFTGLTSDFSAMRKLLSNAVYERPTIEDIMLAYSEGGIKC